MFNMVFSPKFPYLIFWIFIHIAHERELFNIIIYQVLSLVHYDCLQQPHHNFHRHPFKKKRHEILRSLQFCSFHPLYLLLYLAQAPKHIHTGFQNLLKSKGCITKSGKEALLVAAKYHEPIQWIKETDHCVLTSDPSWFHQINKISSSKYQLQSPGVIPKYILHANSGYTCVKFTISRGWSIAVAFTPVKTTDQHFPVLYRPVLEHKA